MLYDTSDSEDELYQQRLCGVGKRTGKRFQFSGETIGNKIRRLSSVERECNEEKEAITRYQHEYGSESILSGQSERENGRVWTPRREIKECNDRMDGIEEGIENSSGRSDGRIDIEGSIEQNVEILQDAHTGESEESLIQREDIIQFVQNIVPDMQRRYIHDVIKIGRNKSISGIMDKFLRGMCKRRLAVISYHDEGPERHFHLLHDCPWRNSECRCWGLDTECRKGHVHNSDADDAALSIAAIIFYFDTDPRRCCFIKIGSFERKLYDRCEHIPDIRYNRRAIHGKVQEEVEEFEICVQSPRPGSENDSQSVQSVREKVRSRGSGPKALPENVAELLMKVCVFPIADVTLTKFWRKSEYCFLLKQDKVFKRALQTVKTILMSYTFMDFIELYLEKSSPVWGNIYLRDDYYYTIEESVEIIEELFTYQMGDESVDLDVDVVCDFVNQLYQVCERKMQKKNCIYILAPPTSGKNFFFDSLFSFYLNIGSQQNLRKGVGFPFDDCVARRLNYWNEPNFAPSFEEELKQLIGGDPFSVETKWENKNMVHKTPIIIMSNKEVFHEQAFKDRMIRYLWRRAEYLKKYTRKPHPLTFAALVLKYVDDTCLNKDKIKECINKHDIIKFD